MRPVRMSYPLPCAMDRLSMDRLLMDRLSVNGANVLSSALRNANSANFLSSAILLLLLGRAIGSPWIGS